MNLASENTALVLKPSGLPVRQFIECTRCLDASRDETSATEWAESHLRRRPHHDTFRTVLMASWRLKPRGKPLAIEPAD